MYPYWCVRRTRLVTLQVTAPPPPGGPWGAPNAVASCQNPCHAAGWASYWCRLSGGLPRNLATPGPSSPARCSLWACARATLRRRRPIHAQAGRCGALGCLLVLCEAAAWVLLPHEAWAFGALAGAHPPRQAVPRRARRTAQCQPAAGGPPGRAVPAQGPGEPATVLPSRHRQCEAIAEPTTNNIQEGMALRRPRMPRNCSSVAKPHTHSVWFAASVASVATRSATVLCLPFVGCVRRSHLGNQSCSHCI